MWRGYWIGNWAIGYDKNCFWDGYWRKEEVEGVGKGKWNRMVVLVEEGGIEIFGSNVSKRYICAMKKKCLQCPNEFESNNQLRKFCSNKCKVAHHRDNIEKNGKKEVVFHQVLVNTILEKLSQVHFVQINPDVPNVFDSPKIKAFNDEPKQWQEPKIKIRRTFEYYQQARLDCSTVEEWSELKAEIMDSDLSQKQKSLLTT